jgi:hypothetical protein
MPVLKRNKPTFVVNYYIPKPPRAPPTDTSPIFFIFKKTDAKLVQSRRVSQSGVGIISG